MTVRARNRGPEGLSGPSGDVVSCRVACCPSAFDQALGVFGMKSWEILMDKNTPAALGPLTSLIVALVSILPIAGGANGAPLGSQPDCIRRGLGYQTLWVFSAARDPADDSILVVDPLRNALLRLDPYQGQIESLSLPQGGGSFRLSPVAVKSSNEGAMLEVSTGELLRLTTGSGSLTVETAETWQPKVKASSLDAMWTWALGGSDSSELIACGDIAYLSEGKRSWRRGLVRLSPRNPGRVEVLYASAVSDPRWVYCRAGIQMFAYVEGKFFVLLEGDKGAGVYVVGEDSTELERLPDAPSELVNLPSLPNYHDLEGFSFLLRAMEESDMAVGLYSWESSLYLLRRRQEGAHTEWSLNGIDPETGRFKGSLVLPTTADQIVVVPGDRDWIFLEKGSLVENGHQGVKAVLLVSSKAIRAASEESGIELPQCVWLDSPWRRLERNMNGLSLFRNVCSELGNCEIDPGDLGGSKSFDGTGVRCTGASGDCGGGWEY